MPGWATDEEHAATFAQLQALAAPVERILLGAGVNAGAAGFRAMDAVWSVLIAVDAGGLDVKELLQWQSEKYGPMKKMW